MQPQEASDVQNPFVCVMHRIEAARCLFLLNGSPGLLTQRRYLAIGRSISAKEFVQAEFRLAPSLLISSLITRPCIALLLDAI
jgi:hypothetical protein